MDDISRRIGTVRDNRKQYRMDDVERPGNRAFFCCSGNYDVRLLWIKTCEIEADPLPTEVRMRSCLKNPIESSRRGWLYGDNKGINPSDFTGCCQEEEMKSICALDCTGPTQLSD